MTDPASQTARIEAFSRARVLVLGDVILDRYVYGTVERMSPEAPIPVLRVEDERIMPGGAGNVARNIAALGGRAILVGLAGGDSGGAALGALFAAEPRIDARLVVEPGRPTTEKTRFVAGRQQLLRTDRETAAAPAAATRAALGEAFARALAEADVVVLSDYAKGVLGDRLLADAIGRAQAAGKPVIADPKSLDFARYRGVSLLTPNRHEIAAATRLTVDGDDDVAAAARRVIESCGVAAVLVTRGDRGMTLVQGRGAPLHLAAEAREVFDVSGAGDTVVATLGVALAAGASPAEAAALANLAGGIVVGKLGTAVVHPADLVGALHAQAVMSSEAKVVALETALERIALWRARGERIGFTNGCFDLIHPGHVSLLQQARAACDRLVVGLNSDASVRRIKGPERPVQGETARAIVLASLGAVDLVVLFDHDTPVELIRAIRPDVLVKGADYRLDQVVGADIVQSYGGRVLLAELVPGQSTTGTIARAGRGGRA
jgi:D-beta-D-heptose 7-phosphate kinase/D-beta-D-heptose 1-phosphate adenosyltransferase